MHKTLGPALTALGAFALAISNAHATSSGQRNPAFIYGRTVSLDAQRCQKEAVKAMAGR